MHCRTPPSSSSCHITPLLLPNPQFMAITARLRLNVKQIACWHTLATLFWDPKQETLLRKCNLVWYICVGQNFVSLSSELLSKLYDCENRNNPYFTICSNFCRNIDFGHEDAHFLPLKCHCSSLNWLIRSRLLYISCENWGMLYFIFCHIFAPAVHNLRWINWRQ